MGITIKSCLIAAAGFLAFTAGCKQQEADIFDRKAAIAEFEEIAAKAKASSGSGHPALWKMGDEDTVIYLFGTVHLLPNDLVWENDIITEAFNASDKVYFEVDIDSTESLQEFQNLVKERGFLKNGENLYKKMSAPKAKLVKNALKDINYDPEALNTLQPWNAGMNVYQYLLLREGYNPLMGVESVLSERATKQGMGFGYVETIEEQFDAISGGDFEQQLEDLIESLNYLDLAPEALDLMLDEWADGDVDGLGVLAASPNMGETVESYERILVNRNKAWIPNIEAILDQPGTNFIAVGAAHLAGPDSVILMLEDNGHVIQRVQ